MTQSAEPGKKTAFAAGAIFLSVFAAYSNTFNAAYHFDDFHQIVLNPAIVPGNIFRFFTDARLESFYASLTGYRPMTFVTFALNYALSGQDVWSYHLLNIILHAFNAFLVFLILESLMGKKGGQFYTVLFASLLFALHPIQTHAVTYISCRAVLLASCFYLLAFLAFMKYREYMGGNTGRFLLGALPPVLYLAGLLSKETAVSLPAALFLYDMVLVRAEKPGAERGLRRLSYYISFVVVLAAYLFIRDRVTGFAVVQEGANVSRGTYFITEAEVFLDYLRLLVFPINQVADYYRQFTFRPDALVIFSLSLVAAMIATLIGVRKKMPLVSFFGLWSLIALAPESSLIPIQDSIVEYRLYIPSIGFFAIAALLTSRLLRERRCRTAAAGALLALLSVLTFSRNFVWADELSLWNDVLKKVPDSPRARGNIAVALMEQGKYSEAIAELNAALRCRPLYFGEVQGRPVFSDQRNVYYEDLGKCYQELRQLDLAADYLRRAVDMSPRQREYYTALAQALYLKKDYSGSVAVLKDVISMYPDYSLAYFGLAQNYLSMKMDAEAVGALEEAIRYNPQDFTAHYNLALVYSAMGEGQRAGYEAGQALSFAADEGQRQKALDMLNKTR